MRKGLNVDTRILVVTWQHMVMTSKHKILKEQEMTCYHFRIKMLTNNIRISHETLSQWRELLKDLFASKLSQSRDLEEYLMVITPLSLEAAALIKLMSLYPRCYPIPRGRPIRCRFSLVSFHPRRNGIPSSFEEELSPDSFLVLPRSSPKLSPSKLLCIYKPNCFFVA